MPAVLTNKNGPPSTSGILRAEAAVPFDEWLAVYDAESVPIDTNGYAMVGIQEIAEATYPLIARQFPANARKDGSRRAYWTNVVNAVYLAIREGGTVRFHRLKDNWIHIQVIESAVKAGLFEEMRSAPGFSARCSRLVPTAAFWNYFADMKFNPSRKRKLVELRTPEDENGEKRPLHFVMADEPVAKEYNEKLRASRESCLECFTTFSLKREPTPHSDTFDFQIDPTEVSIFIGDFDHYGRQHSGKYGHQKLSRKVRSTIRFDGEPSVELDYCGMGPRMLYHRIGMDFAGDPYALWGEETTDEQRKLAKLAMTVAIGASSYWEAVSACVHALGGDRDTAERTVRRVLKLVRMKHKPIAKYFFKGKSLELFRLDSHIAIDVKYRLAKRDIPCLGLHDGFIAPARFEDELRNAMIDEYRKHMNGFDPVIK